MYKDAIKTKGKEQEDSSMSSIGSKVFYLIGIKRRNISSPGDSVLAPII